MNIFARIAKLQKCERNVIERSRDVIRLHNKHMFFTTSCTIFVLFTALSLVALGVGLPHFYLMIYVHAAVGDIPLLVYFSVSLKKPNLRARPAVYLECLFLYALAVIMSLNDTLHIYNAVMMPCFQLILPVLVLDYSFRVNLMVICVFAAYTFCVCIFKQGTEMIMDILNTASFSLAGIVLGTYTRFMQLQNIDRDRILRLQRDTDPLTSLPNRRSLFKLLDQAMSRPGAAVDVIMMDIDFFKQYNDTLGHPTGDACLKMLGDCFADFARQTGLTVCRYGGEEFTAVGTGYSRSELLDLSENLRQKVQDMNIPHPGNECGVVTISLGYAVKTADENINGANLLESADQALYRSKETGRNRVTGAADMAEEAEIQDAEEEDLEDLIEV